MRERPRICLVDLFMPGGGIRVVREISRRLPQALVVVLTASTDRDDLVDAIRAGAAGFLVSNLATNAPSIGASGSIFGLLAALIVYGRRSGASVLMAQLYQWAIVMFVMGFLMSGVNNFAHAGGFAGGWVAAEAMAFIDQRRESLGVQILALALLGLTLVGFVMSFIRVTSLLIRA